MATAVKTPRSKQAEAAGAQLLVHIARTPNRRWQRRGRVFADRYDDHQLN